MDATSEARLGELHPELAEKIRTMSVMLSEENIEIRVVQGLRTWDQQQALYDEGRTMPGRIVTEAQAGYSWHNFGMAADCAPFDDGVPDWNPSHPAWKRMIEVGESLGLLSGSTFHSCPDNPHFQLTGSLPISPDEATRDAFRSGGITAVWALAELS